ncbi:MAG TPA: hypothetical protein VKT82_01400 [Ktedonobacterales bacterium]|nr:hypothetical protein [Ktedonobacterales bacterium]
MRKANKNQPGKQKEREKRPSTPPAGKVELTEQDLEQVQGGQNTHPNIKIDF